MAAARAVSAPLPLPLRRLRMQAAAGGAAHLVVAQPDVGVVPVLEVRDVLREGTGGLVRVELAVNGWWCEAGGSGEAGGETDSRRCCAPSATWPCPPWCVSCNFGGALRRLPGRGIWLLL